MAEIQIERKERTWPWALLGLLVLALLAWWLFSQRDRADFATEDTTGVFSDTGSAAGDVGAGLTGGMTGGGRVEDFVEWTRETRTSETGTPEEADTTHAITADGIRRLAAAIESMAEAGDTAFSAVRAAADSMRAHAEALQRDAQSPNHANHARLAFTQAAQALERLRERRFPDAASTVRQVQQAAQQIRASEPLIEQRQQVGRFFGLAAQTLQSMRGARS